MEPIFYLLIVSYLTSSVRSQLDPDSIIFPDGDNELGSSCTRDSDGSLGICTHIRDCRGYNSDSMINFCSLSDQLVCCKLKTLYNTIDKRFGEENRTTQSNYEHAPQALIGELFEDERRIKWRCGGTLIAPRYVLTSAHCLFAVDIPTYIRITKNDNEKQRIQQTDASIDNIFVHPEYHPFKLYYDIAIIRLNKAVWGYQPVFLPTSDSSVNRENLRVSGWLNSPNDPEQYNLVSDSVRILPNDMCSSHFRLSQLPEGIIENQICGTIADNSSLVPCSGAFLGPLETTGHTIFGIPSFTFGCNNDRPYVFTNIASFAPWIKALIDN